MFGAEDTLDGLETWSLVDDIAGLDIWAVTEKGPIYNKLVGAHLAMVSFSIAFQIIN